MKIKTSELIDAALDLAVAMARDESVRVERGRVRFALSQFTNDYDLYSPSTDWAQGGPIIEREKIELIPPHGEDDPDWMAVWLDSTNAEACLQNGPTPLIAAMRCYVASTLGDEIDIPKELTCV